MTGHNLWRMVRRWVITVVVALVAFLLVSLAIGRLTSTADREPIAQRGPLIVIGMPELSWTEMSAAKNPSLWPIIDVTGATGSVSVRAAHTPTCTPDAWLSLSAGNGAELGCDVRPAPLVSGTTASWPAWSAWAEHNDDERSPADIGLLASELAKKKQCVGAVGPGAALAAADRNGKVSRYAASVAQADLAACAVTFVDLAAPGGGARPDADAALGDVLGRVPADATIVITGLSDGAASDPLLRSLVIVGPGVQRGVIWSPSTHQEGFAQAADVTALGFAKAGVDVPDDVAGQPLSVIPSDSSISSIVQDHRNLSDVLRHEHKILRPYFVGLAVLWVLVLGGAFVLWRRLGRAPAWLRPAALALGAVPVAGFLVNLAPWWRVPGPAALWLVLGVAVVVAVLVGLALIGPWREWPGGPAIVIAAATVVVLGLDVMHGTHLQLLAMQGLQPVYGGRYYGMGNAGFGIFGTAVVLLAGLIGSRLIWWDDTDETDRRLAAATVGVLGAAAIVIDGYPSWGADFGGPPALLTACALLALLVLGIRLTWQRAALVAAAVIVVAGGLAFIDWLRPATSRTHLGRFVQDVLDGKGLGVVGSKLSQNVELLLESPPNLLVPILLGVVIVAVVRPSSRVGQPFQQLWDEVPLLRETVLAVLACWTVAFLLNDSGVGVPATGGLVAIPLLAAVAAAAIPARDPEAAASSVED